MSMPRVSLRNVWFRYGPDHAVLRGLDLDVQDGEIVGLLGRNGAGKTTAFNILAGLLRPDEGSVTVDGIPAAEQPIEVRKGTAFLPDRPLLYEQMSAQENMNMFGLLWAMDARETKQRTERLLRDVGLWDARDQWVRSYSTGMKQKLSICTALLHDPSVILMDEPFTGLDLDAAIWARETFRAQAAAGKSVLFSSHVPELIEALADSVAILDRGVIIEKAPVADVKLAGGAIAYFGLKAPSACT